MTSHPHARSRRRAMWAAGTVVTALLAAMLAGLWLAGRRGDQASVERGRELAELLCTRCHAVSAGGTSPNAKAPPFRTLLQKLTMEGIEDELTEGISLGHQPMPQWQFSGQQIYDLTSFIAALGE